MSSRPLSEGNALQRRYAAWAAGHYARMPEPVRSEAQRIDRWLYSRSGLVFWLGLLSALAASAVGLAAAGLPVWLAVLASLFVWGALALGLLGAWMAPDRFEARRLARVALLTSAFAYLGALAGFLAGRMARHGSLVTETLPEALARAAWQATPILLALVAGVFALMWGVAQLKGVHLQREMAALELVRERDSAARQASEAQLRLLQAQIQPHFIFNTLATVQHWVDGGDPRAGALLRSLTAFLRSSTELLEQDAVSLAEEFACVGHYLAIMQARLGDRLQTRIVLPPELADRQLPPGLVLTLVENAIEHGVSPSLAGAAVELRAQALPEGWQVQLTDDGAGLAAGWQEGTGLSNCRQRLAHHHGLAARLELRSLARGTAACIVVSEAS